MGYEGHLRRFSLLVFLLLTGLFLLFLLDIILGSVYIPPMQVFSVIFGFGADRGSWENIIIEFRLPKALTAILVGSGLGSSGLLMQTLFRNPLAGPYVLGISSGASLGVALTILAGMWLGITMSQFGIAANWVLTASAITGAFAVLLLILAISKKVRDGMSLLIIGLMLGSLTGALVSVLQFYSKAESIQAYLVWTFGSLGGITWEELKIFLPVVIVGILASAILGKALNAMLLGDHYAQSLGLNIKRIRFWIILVTSILAGTVTAFCGPIAFIGIAIPHLSRLLFNTSDHRKLIPLVCLTGAFIMLICDIIAQLPGSEYTLPINAVTSMFGAPVIIWLVIRRKEMSASFN